MIPESIAAILLAVPLGTLVIQSVSYWSEFTKSEGRARSTEKAAYSKPYFYALVFGVLCICLLYTSDAADDLLCVDLGGRRIIKQDKQM